MPSTPSRDLLWVAAGLVAVALLLAAAVATTARDSDQAPTARSPASGNEPSGMPGTKMDRVPPGALLPNLLVLPAEELGIEGSGEQRVLRFASILANSGFGPMQVVPDEQEACPPRQRYVAQRVFVDADANADFDRRVDRRSVELPGGCMLFHPRHEHWHFDSSAGYALTGVDDIAPVVARDKISFCLRDSEPLSSAPERHRRAYAECARDRRQGISVGWADRYDASLPGQRLPLPAGFVDGQYCLRLEVDPFDLLLESDEDDNTSAVVVDIAGPDISRVRGARC